MTNIPPLLENGIFVTNFQTKADIFNDFFVQQCSLNINNSALPDLLTKCDNSLDDIEIDPAKVLTIIRFLDPNKAHGCDYLSIFMIKICDAAIVNLFCLIYKKCLSVGTFPQIWKRPMSFLFIKRKVDRLRKIIDPSHCYLFVEKIFGKVIFDAIYTHFSDNQLLTPNQSGFRPGDSTMNQLIYITHSIFTAFEEFPSRETRAVFLHISKAFDKVWHECLIFKLKSYSISGHLLTLTESYLSERMQRVILNGKSSKWSRVTSGVAQGPVLGPLFFLVYINDLVDYISADVRLFADDISLFTIVHDESVAADQLNRDLEKE